MNSPQAVSGGLILLTIVTVAMPSHCSGPMRSKKVQGLSGHPLRRPDDLSRVVAEHDRRVAMTLIHPHRCA
jgi:hypothetical protein